MQVKCAIYTRVSTDNQAEVEFNSCQAQEEKIIAPRPCDWMGNATRAAMLIRTARESLRKTVSSNRGSAQAVFRRCPKADDQTRRACHPPCILSMVMSETTRMFGE